MIKKNEAWFRKYNPVLTILSGGLLGLSITLSSVGAGTIGVLLILMLVPLVILFRNHRHGFGARRSDYLGCRNWPYYVGHVNFPVLLALMAGSIPMAFLATLITPRIPEKLLQYGLASLLCVLGFNLMNPFIT